MTDETTRSVIQRLRLKWSYWRADRARRRAEGHRRERQRLERKYESESEIPTPLFLYELLRAAVIGLKLQVKP